MSTLDIFVEKGRKKGWKEAEAKKNYEVVRNLLLAGRFTVSEIANFVSVTEAFVDKVKESLPK